jgi:hypothetical protein
MTITSKVAEKYYTACFLNREPSDINLSPSKSNLKLKLHKILSNYLETGKN